jgi:hypothetical protein
MHVLDYNKVETGGKLRVEGSMHVLDYNKVETGGKLRVEGSMHILDYNKVAAGDKPASMSAQERQHDRRHGIHGLKWQNPAFKWQNPGYVLQLVRVGRSDGTRPESGRGRRASVGCPCLPRLPSAVWHDLR